MRLARLIIQLFILFSFPSVIPVCSGWAADLTKTFKSKDYGYTVRYPSSWYRGAKRSDDSLDITNFPPSEAIHAVYIPPGGAEIMVAPVAAFHLREAPQTLNDWITMDTARKHVVSERTFEFGDAPPGMSSIIEVRTEEYDPILETVSWYFHFHGRMFKAMLLYWKGNLNANKLVQILNGVVLSLKLSPRRISRQQW